MPAILAFFIFLASCAPYPQEEFPAKSMAPTIGHEEVCDPPIISHTNKN